MHQTKATCPFKKQPLQNHFGAVGKEPYTEKVVEGNYKTPAGISSSTADFIHQCKLDPINATTKLPRSVELYKESWDKAKERTASCSIHFGHFKAATHNFLNLSLHYALAEIPLRAGYTLKRWQQAIDIMIL